MTVSVTVTNSGNIAGKEVVQLYVRDSEASVERPERELRGFRKVELAPGQRQTIAFELTERDFAYYSTRHDQWIAESGDFELLVGASSRDIRLQANLSLQSEKELNYRFSEYSFFREFWSNPDLKPLLMDLMPTWLGSHTADGMSLADANIQDFLQDQPMIKFPYFTAGEVDAAMIAEFIARCNALTYTP